MCPDWELRIVSEFELTALRPYHFRWGSKEIMSSSDVGMLIGASKLLVHSLWSNVIYLHLTVDGILRQPFAIGHWIASIMSWSVGCKLALLNFETGSIRIDHVCNLHERFISGLPASSGGRENEKCFAKENSESSWSHALHFDYARIEVYSEICTYI